jgi:DNA-directed RNA polymerase specialized sigma24 family protein
VAEQHQTPNSGRLSKKRWRLSEAAFHRLLEWLDEGANSHGEKYLEMRRRLQDYFDRKNCQSPDDLADETLNRVARRLEEEGIIVNTTPARYCYTVAKFIFLERLDNSQRDPVSLDALSDPTRNRALSSPESSESEQEQTEEKQLNCIEQCLQRLEPDDRELISEYYHGEQRVKIENRQRLAARFTMTANALSIRACRIRKKLETCARECLEAMEKAGPCAQAAIGLVWTLEMFSGFSLIIAGTRAYA